MPDFSHMHWDAVLIDIIVVILSITLHEFGHAISADRLGDPTPRRQGRINLWPDKHFDPLGLILIIWTSLGGNGIGWGKPVSVNPNNFKHPRRDMMIVTACGPLMNLLLALLFGLVLRFALTIHPDSALEWMRDAISGRFVWSFMEVNVMLMFFNLIPIHPLDGGKLLSGMLPAYQAVKFDRFFYQFGPIVLLLLVFSGGDFLGRILDPPLDMFIRLIVGL